MENLFGLLKSELLYLREFSSMEKFRIEPEKYIDYSNNRRIKVKLNDNKPVTFLAVMWILILESDLILLMN